MKNALLNRFIGVIDDRDEYQQQEIYKELAFSGMLLWYLSLLLMFISLIIDTVQQTLSFATPALLLINMVYASLLLIKLRQKNLDATECATEEEYDQKKRILKRTSTIAGAQWGIVMLILNQYIFPYFSQEKIQFSAVNIIVWLVAGALFGTTMYFFSKNKLQKHFT